MTYVNAPDNTVTTVVDKQGIWTVLTERRVTVGGWEKQKGDRKIKRVRMEYILFIVNLLAPEFGI